MEDPTFFIKKVGVVIRENSISHSSTYIIVTTTFINVTKPSGFISFSHYPLIILFCIC